MTSSLWRFGITLALFGLASLLPATVGAQPPAYLTQWGTYGSGNGQFINPGFVALDGSGNVYVVDYGNNRIQKFTGSGTYLTQWGTHGSGNGQFIDPFGVAVDGSGNVYVADTGNSRIQKFTSSGDYLTQWGTYGGPSGSDSLGNLDPANGKFRFPIGVAVDGSDNVYVADANNSRIQKFTSTGAYLTQWGTLGIESGQFNQPVGLAVHASGNVYVTDVGIHRIQAFTSSGAYLTQWGTLGSGDGQFANPIGVALDASGNVYAADTQNNRVQVFTGTGSYLTQWGTSGSGSGELNAPYGVALDASGNVYVVDHDNQRIQKFGPALTPIEMVFGLTPNTLNLASQGLWVMGFLEPASPYAASDIDIPSIRLNDTVPVDPATPTALGDHDGNGVPDLMVKFNRLALELTVPEGDSVSVTVTGTVGGHAFSGTDYIRVRRVVVSAPLAGSHLTAGAVTEVRWQTPSGVTVQSAALLHSQDGGSSWSLIASGQPNTGSYAWTVPSVPTDLAKVAVVLVESADASGEIVDGVLGVSEAFSIEGVVGMGDRGLAQLALAIQGGSPAPGAQLRVEFALRDGSPARLELMDVAGRVLRSRQVGALGPGTHSLAISDGEALRPGIYFLRLTQGGGEVRARAAVIR